MEKNAKKKTPSSSNKKKRQEKKTPKFHYSIFWKKNAKKKTPKKLPLSSGQSCNIRRTRSTSRLFQLYYIILSLEYVLRPGSHELFP